MTLAPLLRRLSILGWLILPLALANAQNLPPEVKTQADQFEYDRQQGLVIAKGNVSIEYQDIKVEADQVSVHPETKDIVATGNVVFTRGDLTWRGERVEGNLDTKQFSLGEYESSIGPWNLKGTGAERDESGKITVPNASLSTCDNIWRLESSKVVYEPDGRYRAHHVRYYVGNIPVFYLPVVWGNLEDETDFEVNAGYASDDGFSLRVGKRWQLNEQVTTKNAVIFRSNRGFALQNDTEITTDSSKTSIHLYGMHDDEPLSDRTVAGEEFNGRFESETDRYRLKLRHHHRLAERLTLDINADHISDADLLHEFYREDFRKNPQAPSFLDLTYHGDRFSLSLVARPRLNDHVTTVERLPELTLSIPRQQLFGSNLYYAGRSSGALLRMNWQEHDLGRTDVTLNEADDYASGRIDSLHFLYLPMELGEVNVTPRLGGRVTYYSRSSDRRVTDDQLNSNFSADEPRPTPENPFDVFNYDDEGGEQVRWAGEIGLELSMKRYRLWEDYQSERWDLDGLRHIVQPFVNYTYVPDPDVDKENLYFFDEVDRIAEVHFVRIGTKHRFQTRRDKRIHTFVRMENYYDFHFTPESDQHQPGDLGTNLEVNPTDSFSMWTKFLYDTGRGNLSVFNGGVTLGQKTGPYVDISYLYRDQFTNRFTYSMGSQLTQIMSSHFFPIDFEANESLYVNFRYPINEKTEFRSQHFFDLVEHKLARQRYEIRRDLQCWVGALRFEEEESDISLFLMFYLKALPEFKAGFGG